MESRAPLAFLIIACVACSTRAPRDSAGPGPTDAVETSTGETFVDPCAEHLAMADLGRVPSRSALDDAAAPAVEPADVPSLALEQTLFALAERSKVDGPTLGDWQAHAVRHREVLIARARDKGWLTGSLTRALEAIETDARQRAPGGRQTRAVVLSGAFVADFDGRPGWVITAQWEMTRMLEKDPLGAAKIALGHIRAWAITNDGVILGEAMCD